MGEPKGSGAHCTHLLVWLHPLKEGAGLGLAGRGNKEPDLPFGFGLAQDCNRCCEQECLGL